MSGKRSTPLGAPDWTEALPGGVLDAYENMDDASIEGVGLAAYALARDLAAGHCTGESPARLVERFGWAYLCAMLVRRIRVLDEAAARLETRPTQGRRKP